MTILAVAVGTGQVPRLLESRLQHLAPGLDSEVPDISHGSPTAAEDEGTAGNVTNPQEKDRTEAGEDEGVEGEEEKEVGETEDEDILLREGRESMGCVLQAVFCSDDKIIIRFVIVSSFPFPHMP